MEKSKVGDFCVAVKLRWPQTGRRKAGGLTEEKCPAAVGGERSRSGGGGPRRGRLFIILSFWPCARAAATTTAAAYLSSGRWTHRMREQCRTSCVVRQCLLECSASSCLCANYGALLPLPSKTPPLLWANRVSSGEIGVTHLLYTAR